MPKFYHFNTTAKAFQDADTIVFKNPPSPDFVMKDKRGQMKAAAEATLKVVSTIRAKK